MRPTRHSGIALALLLALPGTALAQDPAAAGYYPPDYGAMAMPPWMAPPWDRNYSAAAGQPAADPDAGDATATVQQPPAQPPRYRPERRSGGFGMGSGSNRDYPGDRFERRSGGFGMGSSSRDYPDDRFERRSGGFGMGSSSQRDPRGGGSGSGFGMGSRNSRTDFPPPAAGPFPGDDFETRRAEAMERMEQARQTHEDSRSGGFGMGSSRSYAPSWDRAPFAPTPAQAGEDDSQAGAAPAYRQRPQRPQRPTPPWQDSYRGDDQAAGSDDSRAPGWVPPEVAERWAGGPTPRVQRSRPPRPTFAGRPAADDGPAPVAPTSTESVRADSDG